MEPKKQKIDWEQRRYEVAKEVLPKCIDLFQTTDPAQCAVNFAEQLINELKQRYKYETKNLI